MADEWRSDIPCSVVGCIALMVYDELNDKKTVKKSAKKSLFCTNLKCNDAYDVCAKYFQQIRRSM